METIEISGVLGLIALGSLTANFLVGLFIWTKSKIKLPKGITFLALHKFTGYSAAITILIHILLIPLDPKSEFTWSDLLLPLWTVHQPFANAFGAISLYLILVVVVTSYYKDKIKYSTWRTIHFTSYFAAIPLFLHSIITDPLLKDRPIDWIDAEKVFVELCAVVVLGLIVYRFVIKKKVATT
ncbi:MAG: ferric reductase-like transmembrane domain-containing protein [Cyclobacteriaceae bacterium]|jgi:predicted ferric reductase|nr:ferric reductase-like transmembrane domain-containing protein [Cyclobacteriaceae bacterium]